MKRHLINFATALCGTCAVVVIILYATSSAHPVGCFLSVHDKRYDLNIERGSLFLCQLDDYRFKTPFRWGLYEAETPKEFEAFTKLPWWHGDNSWWERVGYTVESRQRHFGFEYASGQYWPPFARQHPEVPFTVYQLPLWSLITILTLLPLLRVFIKIPCAIRRKNATEKTAN